MAITGHEAREEILDDLAIATDLLAVTTASLGEAYDMLSVTSADRMEAGLFRPAQKAFGRCKRAQAQFASRSGLQSRDPDTPQLGPPSQGAKGFIEAALTASVEADRAIAKVQDSDLAIEFGDPELRAGLSEVRSFLHELPGATREFLRTLGR